jgi:hypothetical protein
VWPWVLIGLPALSVAVSVLTLVLAVGAADSVVGDDWYKRGLAINQDLDRAAAAARLGVAATVAIDRASGALVVSLDRDTSDEALTLELQHPTLAARDRRYLLAPAGGGAYRAELGAVPAGRWYVVLAPASGAWRIAASLVLAPDAPARLVPAA